MDKKTLTALEGSIEKWRKIVIGEGVDNAGDNCPLCKLYISLACNGCPVKDKSGRQFCIDTPYADFIRAVRNEKEEAGLSRYESTNCVIGYDSHKAAINEYNFLYSLLP